MTSFNAKCLIVLFLMASPILAAAQFRSGNALTTELKGSNFTATVAVGYHFNEKAPNGLVLDDKKLKPTKIEARKVEFLNLPKFKVGFASVYICDDALTFCEPRRIELGENSKNVAKEGAASTSTSTSKKKSLVTNADGFIVDDFSGAVEKALREKKLLLLDFSARWCPGCIRLEKEVFKTAAFRKQTADFVKVKIDVDRFENIVLSEKYAIRGIPTIIAVDPAQKEIERFYDYQPALTVQKFIESVRADATPLETLLEKNTAANSAQNEKIGRRLFAAGNAAQAVAYLQKVEPAPAELATAQVTAARTNYKADEKTKDMYIKTLREAIAKDPSSTRAITWRMNLVELLTDTAEIQKLISEGVAAADALLADRSKIGPATRGDLVGEFSGYEPLMVASARADLVAAGGAEKPEAKEAWKKAAQVGRELKIKTSDRGPALRHLIVLTAAEEYGDALKLVQALLKDDPKNPELQRRQLRTLVGLRKFSEAIKVGQQALKESYGRNEYWVAEQLAKAYLGAGKKAEANALLDRYLKREDADWANLKPTLESMRKMRDS